MFASSAIVVFVVSICVYYCRLEFVSTYSTICAYTFTNIPTSHALISFVCNLLICFAKYLIRFVWVLISVLHRLILVLLFWISLFSFSIFCVYFMICFCVSVYCGFSASCFRCLSILRPSAILILSCALSYFFLNHAHIVFFLENSLTISFLTRLFCHVLAFPRYVYLTISPLNFSFPCRCVYPRYSVWFASCKYTYLSISLASSRSFVSASLLKSSRFFFSRSSSFGLEIKSLSHFSALASWV